MIGNIVALHEQGEKFASFVEHHTQKGVLLGCLFSLVEGAKALQVKAVRFKSTRF